MSANKQMFLLVLLVLLPFSGTAQEYRYELGGRAGVASYMGDVNTSNPFYRPNMAVGAVFRQNLNYRWAWKADLILGKVSGKISDASSAFPSGTQASFDRVFGEFSAQVEFNFFAYGDGGDYLGTQPFTPYLAVGLGITWAMGDNSRQILNVPLGVGVKYKWNSVLNVAWEFSVRRLTSDAFDAWNNPYGVKGGFLKNTDSYALTTISLTWNFGKRRTSACCP